jgi:hypothetical protein
MRGCLSRLGGVREIFSLADIGGVRCWVGGLGDIDSIALLVCFGFRVGFGFNRVVGFGIGWHSDNVMLLAVF